MEEIKEEKKELKEEDKQELVDFFTQLYKKEGKSPEEIEILVAEKFKPKPEKGGQNKKVIEEISAESPKEEIKKEVAVKKTELVKVEEKKDDSNKISLGSIETNCQRLPMFAISQKDMRTRKEILYVRKTKNEERTWHITKLKEEILWPGPFAKKVFRALNDIMVDILKEEGEVKNPIEFTFAQICRLSKFSSSGNYKHIEEAIKQVRNLTCSSKGIFYNKKIGDNIGTLTEEKTFYVVTSFGKRDYKSKYGRLIFEKSEISFFDIFLSNINEYYLSSNDRNFALSLPNIPSRLYEIFDSWFFANKNSEKPTPFIQVYYSNLCQLIPIEGKEKIYNKKDHFRKYLEKLVKEKFLEKYEFVERGKEKLLIKLWSGKQVLLETKERKRRKEIF